MAKKPTRSENMVGFLTIAGMITGCVGLIGAVLAFLNADWTGTGLCLAAAALAFGLLANALLRD